MMGINGAIPNHPKKQRKNASHVMWNARIGALEKSAKRIRVALLRSVILSRFSLS
jgi:type IV secretory pathway TrbF-like protein